MALSDQYVQTVPNTLPPEEREEINRQLEKLHNKVPKYIGPLRNTGNQQEMETALKALMKLFDQINALEIQLLDEGKSYTYLSLSRIYDLAVNGNGSGTASTELEQAYQVVTDERDALLGAVQSLTFTLEKMKGKAADEILGLQGKEIPSVEKLAHTTASIAGYIDTVHDTLKKLGALSSDGPAVAAGSLDQQILESMSNFDDLTAKQLSTASTSRTVIGRVTRHYGLAFDYKDAAAARQLIALMVKANKKLADVTGALEPIMEKISAIHQMMVQIEPFLGHEERQSPQYKSAMEEIDRLSAQLEQLKNSPTAAPQAPDTPAETAATEAAAAYSAAASGPAPAAAPPADHPELTELDKAIKAKQDELGLQDIKIQLKTQTLSVLQADLDRVRASIDEKLGELEDLEKNAELNGLTADEKTKKIRQLEAKLRTAENRAQQQVAIVKNKMRELESGLLMEKLEHELLKLREIAKEASEALTKEQSLREALEDRTSLWIQEKPQMDAQVEKHKKTAQNCRQYAALFAAVTGAAGYGIATALDGNINDTIEYLTYTTAAMTVLSGGAGYGIGKSKNEGLFYALSGAGIGFISGLAAGALALIAVEIEKEKLEGHKLELLSECKFNPCIIIDDGDGKRAVRISDAYKGQKIILDYTFSRETPVITEQPLTLEPEPQQ
ncbi:MAG TPA: hypothetical protein PLO23_02445 [Alphaproteobacteria bacterium]|nr:hypothetical protein [Alphaproteobacteria bacterium]